MRAPQTGGEVRPPAGASGRSTATPTSTTSSTASRKWGGTNIVTDIVFDYRGYDTLGGEATVLFTAIAGAVALLRPWRRDGDE